MNTKVNDLAETATKKAASLTGMAKAKLGNVSRRDSPLIPLEMLEIEPGYNIRGAGMSQEEYWQQDHIKAYVDGLVQSYTEGAYVPPIVVKFDKDRQKAIIVDGHHRFYALSLVVEAGVPIERVEVTEHRGDEKTQVLLMLQSANALELSAVDRAKGFHKLYSYGLDPQEIADKTRKSITHVNDMLAVYNLPTETQRLIQQKKLSYANALAGVREANPKKAKSITPPKKVVLEFMDIITEFKNAPVDNDGKVNISIPAEMLEKLLANLPETDAPVNNDQNELPFPQ